LGDAGHVAYFPGGCVRDELLGLHPKDYDVATSATPDEVRPLFKRVNEVGVSFGVMLVRDPAPDGPVVEVATFREESGYTDNRRPDEVRFSDARADAQRRDYTVNALFLDPLDTTGGERGAVIDFVHGLADLDAKQLRAVGDPDARLAEDHLRALRAVRLAARLGFTIEPSTAEAIARHATQLAGVSRERIGDELRRMLAHPARSTAIDLLERLRLDAPTLDADTDHRARPGLEGLSENAPFACALAAWEIDRAHPSEEGLDAGALAKAIREAPLRVRTALCLSNDERDDFVSILRLVSAISDAWGAHGVATRKRLASRPRFADALAIVAARDHGLAASVLADVTELAATPSGLAPEPLVTGDDLVAAGHTPGPGFKAALDAAYDAQLECRVDTTKDALAEAERALRERP
ncbi:MAG: CCA tRNA nucleotidyltransferase, partial [Phycisphaerales bacterium]